jgi:phytoene dehydrogenase-like protein
MSPSHDAIVIGAGHNGLACACYLARAGLKVLVLEQYHTFGGMTLTEEVTLPGFWSDVHASGYQLANFSPAPRELELARHGLALVKPEVVYAHAFADGRVIAVHRDVEKSIASIARFSQRDAAAWRALSARYQAERAGLIAAFFAPPASFAEQAAAMQRTPGGMDRYRFSLQSMRSWCNELFETEEVKCLQGAFALFVGHAPDDAGGAESAYLFGHVLQAEGNNLVQGGMHGVPRALAADLREHGGEIRTSAAVERIVVAGGRATAVRLAGGEEIPVGKLVASSTDPAQLILRLLGEQVVGQAISANMRRYEWGDATMVIWVALDGPVDYRAGAEAGAAAHVHLTAASLDALARASDECRAGLLPAAPFIVSWNDSAIDPSRAPAGKHLKKFVVLGVPYQITGDATGQIAGRDWDTVRERYADYLIDLIETNYLPSLKARILKRVVHSPLDLERKLSSAVRGTIPHGAMVPYQMGALRPIPELGHYRTPVPNVYLCGSGTHPGAGVSMASGRNAAQVIYDDLHLNFAKAFQP